jgi:hypothetical protein
MRWARAVAAWAALLVPWSLGCSHPEGTMHDVSSASAAQVGSGGSASASVRHITPSDAGRAEGDAGTGAVHSGAVDAGRASDAGRTPHACFLDALSPPMNHRPASAPCARGSWTLSCDVGSDCTTLDIEPVPFPNAPIGKCIASDGGTACTFDTCSTDNDCGPNAVCICQHTSGLSQWGNICQPSQCNNEAGNICPPIQCSKDADCPSGYCSPALGPCGYPIGNYCHTCEDTCTNDSDCDGYCGYDSELKHFVCENGESCTG